MVPCRLRRSGAHRYAASGGVARSPLDRDAAGLNNNLISRRAEQEGPHVVAGAPEVARLARRLAEREKMPFEVTPFMPYLTRFNADTSKPANASSAGTKPPETASLPGTDPKPADPTKP